MKKVIWSKEISMTSKNSKNANWSLSRKEDNFYFFECKSKDSKHENN